MDGGPILMFKSLRGKLFSGLTAIILITGAISGTFAYRWAYNEAIETQDSVLSQVGTFVANATVRQSQPVKGVDADTEITVEELGAMPTGSSDDRRFWSLPDGLHNDVYRGQPVRALVRTRPDGSRFAVTQRTEIRSEIAGDMALRTLLPIAALVPCLMLVTAFVIARSFRPMVRLAHELDLRKPDDVRALTVTGAPGELQPFLGSINGLLNRIRTMMEQQRRFIADAAHELRTPITAISLQAENLDPVELPPGARERLDALKSGTRRTRHLLEQLLALARQDAERAPSAVETMSLDAIAKGVAADLLPQAAARDIDLGFKMAEDVSLKGDALSLMSAVRNLVENAVKFTPDGGRVDLAVYKKHGMAILEVEDTGPGIAPDELPRIFEPFFRGQRPTGDGSGLGLSIVKRIVERYAGSVVVENIADRDCTGVRARIELPCLD
jgi:two-component system, OmpR family, sensor kinase